MLEENATESLLEDFNIAEDDLIVVETQYVGKYRLEKSEEDEEEEIK